jgi:acid phosphatase family membrane protein YuiD
MVGRVSDIRYCCWQVMYDATGVRLQAGRQAEVWYLVLFLFLFFRCQRRDLKCHRIFLLFTLILIAVHEISICFDWSQIVFPESEWLFFSQVLNQIVIELPAEHPLADSRPLRELLGHTPPQVQYSAFDCFSIHMIILWTKV